MKIIGIVGSRRRDSQEDYELLLKAFLEIYEEGDKIVSGGCPKGGDFFAEVIANKAKIPIIIHKAEWNKYGRGAGMKRNTYIAEDSDIIIAIVAPDRTGGTEDTIRKAIKLGKKIIII